MVLKVLNRKATVTGNKTSWKGILIKGAFFCWKRNKQQENLLIIISIIFISCNYAQFIFRYEANKI